MKFTDMILQTSAKVAVFIILTFAVFLFFAGHHNPGGGFIGGLVTASALVLMYIAFDVETVHKIIPFDYKKMAALGVLIAVSSGLAALLFDAPILSQTFGYVEFPIIGTVELATAVIFDLGVYLTVVGVASMIILSIGEDV